MPSSCTLLCNLLTYSSKKSRSRCSCMSCAEGRPLGGLTSRILRGYRFAAMGCCSSLRSEASCLVTASKWASAT